ncbi:E3 ubiquitin-protein ligase TRIM45-like [Saccostrea cucullata]|uniref:E3 ubiquitin-protein ligase TRIM45-like n=1 Tax=Saccostrea cuccullata TaxID=36930 RepID=UPI002ED2838A
MDQVPNTAQHFIECDLKSCRNFSEFYCSTCHKRICDKCKQRHLKQNKEHKIVPYHEKKRKVPSEGCWIHPTGELHVFCDDCYDPICPTCFAQHHSDHEISDLETIYNYFLHNIQTEITEIWKEVIPGVKNNVESTRNNAEKEIANLRDSMKKRADELKKVVYITSVLNKNNKKLDEIENSLQSDMVKQQKIIDDFINYLEEIIINYERNMLSLNLTELMEFHTYISIATLRMPKIVKPKLPIFRLRTLNKEDKQFGEIEIDSPEIIKLTPVIKVTEVNIQEYAFHLSFLPPDKFWAVDSMGNLIQYDMEGNILHKISTSFRNIQSNHTVTKNGELLYTDNSKNTVCRVTSDMSINKLI